MTTRPSAGEPVAPSVSTLTGEIGSDALGVTLVHEHLFVLSTEIQANFPHLWDRTTGIDRAVRGLQAAYNRGVRTIVDMSVLGQGRNIHLAAKVAARVPMKIVVATGVYSVDGIPLFARFRGPGSGLGDEDPLIELLMHDMTQGIGGTGVCASLVKFASEAAEPDMAASRMAVVVAEVSRRTGAPVVVHTNPTAENGHALARLVMDEGVPPDRIVLAHVGDSGNLRYLQALAETGCYLGFDRYGMTAFAADEQRNEMLAALISSGHVAQLLVSQDHASHIDYITESQRQELYPLWSYTHLHDHVVPMLRADHDIDDHVVETLLIDNPRRLLTPMLWDLQQGKDRP